MGTKNAFNGIVVELQDLKRERPLIEAASFSVHELISGGLHSCRAHVLFGP
jgi:hypothetical protein